MKLTRGTIATYTPETRDTRDMRYKVAKAVFSYYDENGVEYRKAFTAIPNTTEHVFYLIAPKEIIINQ